MKQMNCHCGHTYMFMFSSRRSVEVANTSEPYEKVLHRSVGFANPSVVEFLLGKMGINDSDPPSLMRGLQRSVVLHCLHCFLVNVLLLKIFYSLLAVFV